MKIQKFTVNPFQENTYILYDDSKECIIIDPGMYEDKERAEVTNFIESNQLVPVRLINTHCHLDHIFSNGFISEKYNLTLEIHQGELQVLQYAPVSSKMYGVQLDDMPQDPDFIEEGQVITFGDTILHSLFTPGHSPASLSFFNPITKALISGDVLFYESIGRTDLPGGDMNTLINNIKTKLFTLGDDVVVYPGHGPTTTIAHEKTNNPFI